MNYGAEDSIRFNLTEQKVYLYGNAKVSYKAIELKADRIVFSFQKNTVFAEGTPDSTGEITGQPDFSDGDKDFDAKRIRYDFKTKKGLIEEVHTQEGDGDLYSERTKRHSDDEIHVKNGKYTTCKLEDYYIRFGKAVAIPGDKIVSGPANLVIGGIPTPLVLPFGYYPNKKGGSSGLLIPSYGESPALGFYLTDGGYYWAINDRMHTQITGDIYSRGSWGIKNQTQYKERYRYSGNVNLEYSSIRRGVGPEFPDYRKTNEFFIRWNHRQAPEARPNSRFSANVNAGTSSNFRNNFNSNTEDYLTNTFQSNISYRKNWPNKPYHINANLRHDQNTRTERFNITIPQVSFNMNRVYPLKGLRGPDAVGGKRWYEKIGFTYSANLENRLSVKNNELRRDNLDGLRRQMRNGLRHQASLNTSLDLGVVSMSPSARMTEKWYFRTVEDRWDPELDRTVTDTITGFRTARNFRFNNSFTTKLYGMFSFTEGPVKAIRHVITPEVTFSYRPDLSQRISRDIDNDGIEEAFSPFRNTLFGGSNARRSGRINFGVQNNLEMKVRQRSDTGTSTKKVSLIDNFSVNSSYDMFKDSIQWSSIRLSGRTRLFNKVGVNFSGRFDPYARDSLGRRIGTSRWKRDGTPGKLSSARISVNTSFQGKDRDEKDASESKAGTPAERAHVMKHPEEYVDFSVPWDIRLNYNLRVDRRFIGRRSDTTRITQSLSFDGNLRLTENWKVGFNSGYDLKADAFTYTTIDIYRDLGCWEMSFNWIPFGNRRSYSFRLNIKAPILKDLKLQRKREWFDRDVPVE